MKIEELKAKIADILSRPEEAPAEMTGLISEIEKDYAELEESRTEIASLRNKNQTLHDTNMRLFLAQTSSVDDSAGEIDESKKKTIGDLLTEMEEE